MEWPLPGPGGPVLYSRLGEEELREHLRTGKRIKCLSKRAKEEVRKATLEHSCRKSPENTSGTGHKFESLQPRVAT